MNLFRAVRVVLIGKTVVSKTDIKGSTPFSPALFLKDRTEYTYPLFEDSST